MTHDFSYEDLQLLIDCKDFNFLITHIDTMTVNTRNNLIRLVDDNLDIVPNDLKNKLKKYR